MNSIEVEFMDQWVGAKCVLVWGKGTGVGTSVPRTLLCSEHPSLTLVPWPGLPGHAQILNYVASLTDHLSQGPRDISCPDFRAQHQTTQAQPVEGASA